MNKMDEQEITEEIFRKYVFDIYENIQTQTPDENGEYIFLCNRDNNQRIINGILLEFAKRVYEVSVSYFKNKTIDMGIYILHLTDIKTVKKGIDINTTLLHCKIDIN